MPKCSIHVNYHKTCNFIEVDFAHFLSKCFIDRIHFIFLLIVLQNILIFKSTNVLAKINLKLNTIVTYLGSIADGKI